MNNHDLIETNELSKNSNGGTEIFLRFLYDGGIPRNLLDQAQIIPGRVRNLKEDKIRILTLHDLPEDPEYMKLADASYRNKFHKLVFISNWQYQHFRDKLGIPYDNHSLVIESGSSPVDADISNKPDDVINIAYFTTPHRGLSILLPVFDALSKQYPNIHLHVHSSFKAYGWDSRDKEYETLFDFARKHPKITYYGYTPHDELRKLIKNYHIFAYPSIWTETSCRSLIEAISGGLVAVHPNLGALADTAGGMSFMYDGSSNIEEHSNIFCAVLENAIQAVASKDERLNNTLMFAKHYIDNRFSPNNIQMKWTNLLNSLVGYFPTPESRKLTNDDFIVFDTNAGLRR